jgi:hypothetical protein
MKKEDEKLGVMQKRKDDEKRGQMKKKDEKPKKLDTFFRNKLILRTRQVRRTPSQARRLRRVTGGREKGGEGGAPWMCVRRPVAYMSEYLLGLPTFFFFFSFFACN